MRGLLDAIAFLTRIPVPVANAELRPSAVPWFPVVGLMVGAAAGLVYWGVALAFDPTLAAIGAVATAVAVTGAFHEDGLADTFDGLSSIRSRERQIEIMRDSRLGTFGVTALVLVLAARVVLLADFAVGGATVLALAWAHGMSRGVAVGVLSLARPGPEGAGAHHVRGVPRSAALGVAGVVAAAGGWVFGWLPLVLAGLGGATVWWWAHRRLGGVTGDVLGACQQIALVGALAGLSP